jgi:endonuclease/exonuclease/phosphatase family metal-dependent hydrolase
MNKSPSCQHSILSNNHLVREGINIIALQKPALSGGGLTISSRDWVTVYPMNHTTVPLKSRSLTLIRVNISTKNWSQLDFPSSNVMVTQITRQLGKITIFNIYNDGENNETIRLLTEFHCRNKAIIKRMPQGKVHVIWLGDFNRHHPYWDSPEDTRLFMSEATEVAEKLIEAMADVGLELALPSGLPTHKHSITKCWTRLDQVFLSEHSSKMLIFCDTKPEARGINTDHLPILIELCLKVSITVEESLHNFRNVNWEDFRTELEKQLSSSPNPARIMDQGQLNAWCNKLTKALQETIRAEVPTVEVTLKSKQWRTKELLQL